MAFSECSRTVLTSLICQPFDQARRAYAALLTVRKVEVAIVISIGGIIICTVHIKGGFVGAIVIKEHSSTFGRSSIREFDTADHLSS